ncbi:hypothetical protein A3I27_03385 [Candidatus Giovannonibacteria bacterium RIFCSPLOWO2_02_FULL_43_11b]|nr:MAG: hypothetical protein A3I27_03385 [Candidatus Giovannonibacteria bacterium RIFCSPLOWO2_02_FULL_43_11b]OGF91440.1 MAG: hypothetical protein A3H04_03135 [Candidatus Giovannonibacteria bacterium RIFCSPLOWO2_12_FULL_43_11c]
MKISRSNCPHLGEMKITSSDAKKCEISTNLRLCTSCWSVFCCESHKAHNREHFKETDHPIIIPLPIGTPLSWTWCWIDNAYLE